jgi:hypothetical protein
MLQETVGPQTVVTNGYWLFTLNGYVRARQIAPDFGGRQRHSQPASSTLLNENLARRLPTIRFRRTYTRGECGTRKFFERSLEWRGRAGHRPGLLRQETEEVEELRGGGRGKAH